MADLFDYLDWRGDLPFSQVPVNPVDALLFAALSYIDFDGIVPRNHSNTVSLADAAARFAALPDAESRVRTKHDAKLLERMAQTARFGSVRLTGFDSQLIPEEETQFAAITFLPTDYVAVVTYRGTDSSVVGWKEDFAMSFSRTVPAQRKALAYLQIAARNHPGALLLTGHSKGGNLSVFAAAMAGPEIQPRIHAVYNNDGPGFTDFILESPGYQTMLPRIHTYIPQSSIIGMLLEHKDPYTLIRSRTVSVLQHELYTWEVMGGDFIPEDDVSAGSQVINDTITSWLATRSNAERSAFVETLFDLVEAGNADQTDEILRPRNIQSYIKTLVTDEESRHLLATELSGLLRSARDSLRRSRQKVQPPAADALPEKTE